MRGTASGLRFKYGIFYILNRNFSKGLGIILLYLVVLLLVEGYSFLPPRACWLRSKALNRNNVPNYHRSYVRPNLFRRHGKDYSFSHEIFSWRHFGSPRSLPDSGAPQYETKEAPAFDENLFQLFDQSNSSLYLPKSDVDPRLLHQSPERELIDVDQAFYRMINEMILNNEQNFSSEAILDRILAVQNENGTVAYPLPEKREEEDIENDPEYGPIFSQIMQSFQKPFTAMKEWLQSSDKLLSPKLRTWRDHVVQGIEYFKQHELTLAKDSFNAATALGVNQTMQQRGMLLYCLGEYNQAVDQFLKDIKHLEKDKLFKVSDLRLWASACYNRLGDQENALKILDVDNLQGFNLIDETPFMNLTMQFYANRIPIDDMVEFLSDSINMEDEEDDEENSDIDESEDDEEDRRIAEDAANGAFMDQIYEKYQDLDGSYFFGNFYTALYYDSIQEEDMMKAFLEYPANCHRYSPTDLWFHLPRILYESRRSRKED